MDEFISDTGGKIKRAINERRNKILARYGYLLQFKAHSCGPAYHKGELTGIFTKNMFECIFHSFLSYRGPKRMQVCMTWPLTQRQH